MSAPKSSGRCNAGVQKQLSTASNTPRCFATAAMPAISDISVRGLDGVSRKNSRVLGRTATSHSFTSVAETKVVSTPKRLKMVPNKFTVEPNILREATM